MQVIKSWDRETDIIVPTAQQLVWKKNVIQEGCLESKRRDGARNVASKYHHYTLGYFRDMDKIPNNILGSKLTIAV